MATNVATKEIMLTLYSCLFIWDNQTTVDRGTDQEPSKYSLALPSLDIEGIVDRTSTRESLLDKLDLAH